MLQFNLLMKILILQEWISVSNPVMIYNDSLDSKYHKIRGSRNSRTDLQDFGNTSKSIKWTFTNLDRNFSFYRIAIIQANLGDGNAHQAVVSDLISTDYSSFTYTGNDSSLTATPLEDIQVTAIDIASAKYITQLDNRLILADIKGKQIDWCSFQSIASKIKK